MAEEQPPTVVEGATTGDVEEDVPATAAKSAEDRKAANALASLGGDDESRSANTNVDAAAVNEAMKRLGGVTGAPVKKTTTAKTAQAAPAKNVKVDQADVALLAEELDLAKPKATDLLKKHDGDAVRAMRAYVTTGAGA